MPTTPHVNPHIALHSTSSFPHHGNPYTAHHGSLLSPVTHPPLTPNVNYTAFSHTPISSQDAHPSSYSPPTSLFDTNITSSIPFSVPIIIS